MENDLKTAQDMLRGWIMAEQAVMTGQEYRMGTKMLRRADLSMIADRVNFWKAEVNRLERGSKIRVQQIVLRDV